MSLSINTNSSASMAASNLNSTNSMLQKSLQRLSSGCRIVDSSDNAGGLAVSTRMSASIRRGDATATNVANAQSFLKTQDGALATATQVLTRMSELTTLAQDVTKTSGETASYEIEFIGLQSKLTVLGSGTFNGESMFSASSTATTAPVHTSADSSTSVTITKAALTGDPRMAAAISADTTISSVAGAAAATETIHSALESLATMRAQNGTESSQLAFSQEMLTTNRTNLEAANRRIVDADVAAESAQLARFNILQQAGTAMLAQANQSAQSVLRLLS